MSSAFHEVCACGRVFAQLNALHKHKGSCQVSKKRLSSALEQAQGVWLKHKKPRFANRDKVLGRSDSVDLVEAHNNMSTVTSSVSLRVLSSAPEGSHSAVPVLLPQQLEDDLIQSQVIVYLHGIRLIQ